jgi:osmotically inducible lipoprotein OsmB
MPFFKLSFVSSPSPSLLLPALPGSFHTPALSAQKEGHEKPSSLSLCCRMLGKVGCNCQKHQDFSVKTKQLVVSALVISMAIGLAGCGYSPGSRALSGGAIGAGAGSIIGAVTGLGPAGGALIGGAAGAIGGAVTNPNTVNLGHSL